MNHIEKVIREGLRRWDETKAIIDTHEWAKTYGSLHFICNKCNAKSIYHTYGNVKSDDPYPNEMIDKDRKMCKPYTCEEADIKNIIE